jgi:hypothetical protein
MRSYEKNEGVNADLTCTRCHKNAHQSRLSVATVFRTYKAFGLPVVKDVDDVAEAI